MKAFIILQSHVLDIHSDAILLQTPTITEYIFVLSIQQLARDPFYKSQGSKRIMKNSPLSTEWQN